MNDTDLAASVERDGFAVVSDALSADTVAALITAVENISDGQSIRRRETIYAVRNLPEVSEVVALARSAVVHALVSPLLGADCFPVRGISRGFSPVKSISRQPLRSKTAPSAPPS